jgi:heme-degrading monooxygenase HmoA
MDHARDTIGITISYWDSLESIEKWKQNNQHLKAKTLGREKWYASYSLKVCKVLY